MDYGRNVLFTSGSPVEVCDGGDAIWHPTGITMAWNLITPNASPVLSAAEQLTIPAGAQYIRYGQVLTMVTNQPTQTITITGTPTGGTFTVSGNRLDTGAYVTTAPIAYNASAAAVAAALNDVAAFGPGWASVTGTGPYVVTTPLGLLTANGAGLTGGTAPAAAVALTTTVTTPYGQYGPYDPAATDGRANLNPGQTVINNTTVINNGMLGFSRHATAHPGVLDGGLVWQKRVIATNGTASLAAGPTWATLLAAMPTLRLSGIG